MNKQRPSFTTIHDLVTVAKCRCSLTGRWEPATLSWSRVDAVTITNAEEFARNVYKAIMYARGCDHMFPPGSE